MLGLPKGEVFLFPYTEEWEKDFLNEKEKINRRVGNDILAIHHIGSTAVKGLSVKPILDIAIEINNLKEGEHISEALETNGYAYKGTNILPERHYLIKGEPRTHQIHMYESGNKYLIEQLRFRDYLRENDNARLEYEELKHNLAASNKRNKHKYAEEKTFFIQSVLKKM